jgi:transcription-repair coupling factor (superfamily II helicase)
VRGGIVDVFASTRRSPVRVEWWGDEIESVRAVSLATQRVVRELETVTLYAAREGDLAGPAATDDELPEEARRGVRVPGLDRLLLGLGPSPRAGCCPRASRSGARSRRRTCRRSGWAGPDLYDPRMPEPDVEFAWDEEGETSRRRRSRRSRTRCARRPQAGLAGRGRARGLRRVLLAGRGQADGVRVRGDQPPHARAERVDPGLPPGLYAVPGEVEEGFTYP